MTFDNEDEMIKVVRLFPEAELVLRIITDDSKSLCKFSSKFGALLRDVRPILKLGQQIGAKIIGVSFHVGSGCEDPSAFGKAVRDAATVFEWGKEYGYEMRLLDLGGGFQGDVELKPALSEVADQINAELWRFPEGTRFIAEPGRYFATKSHTLVLRVHSRRVIRDEQGSPVKVLYYVNDGVYQSFNCIFFDHQHPHPLLVPLPSTPSLSSPRYPCTIFGPTCDSLDMIFTSSGATDTLPLLEVGQWLYFVNMGAYTSAAATHFNGFSGAVTCHYFWGAREIPSTVDIIAGDLPGIPPRQPSRSSSPISLPEPHHEEQQPTAPFTLITAASS
jgi:diaminopimelate decarboxylase